MLVFLVSKGAFHFTNGAFYVLFRVFGNVNAFGLNHRAIHSFLFIARASFIRELVAFNC